LLETVTYSISCNTGAEWMYEAEYRTAGPHLKLLFLRHTTVPEIL